jgi:DNA-binding protein HU-beta
MTKAELIERVYKEMSTALSKRHIREVIDTTFKELAKSFKKEKRFSYPGFGSFIKRRRKARQGRNPQTGEPISIPAKTTIVFRPAQALKDLIKRKS